MSYSIFIRLMAVISVCHGAQDLNKIYFAIDKAGAEDWTVKGPDVTGYLNSLTAATFKTKWQTLTGDNDAVTSCIFNNFKNRVSDGDALTAADAAAVFAGWDADNGGFVTSTEFAAQFQPMYDATCLDRTVITAEQLKHAAAFYAAVSQFDAPTLFFNNNEVKTTPKPFRTWWIENIGDEIWMADCIFTKFDTNRDGTIDSAEALDMETPPEPVYTTLADYQREMGKIYPACWAEANPHSGGKIFKGIDADTDGKISAMNIFQYFEMMTEPQFIAKWMGATGDDDKVSACIFKKFNKDGDANLGGGECLAMLGEIDADKDASASLAEFSAWINPIYGTCDPPYQGAAAGTEEEQIWLLFKAIDSSKFAPNGELTFSEMEVFFTVYPFGTFKPKMTTALGTNTMTHYRMACTWIYFYDGNEAKMSQKFPLIDTNKNEVASWDEFLIFMTNIYKNTCGTSAPVADEPTP